jgi:predicted porin
LAATSAFAQSSVTISGLVDTAYVSQNAPAQTADTKGLVANGSSTSVLTVAGTEDLGGGLKANFQVQLTPDFINGAAVGNGTTGQQAFVGLSGKFGDIKAGRVNTAALDAWGVGSALGTAIGSGYGSNGNIFTRYSATPTDADQAAPTRFNKSIRYTTPAFMGLTASVLTVPKNSDNTTTATNTQGVTDVGLRYQNGPLNVAYANQKISGAGGVDNANQVIGSGGAATLPDGKTNKLSVLSANYTIGATKLFAATWTEKQDTSTAVDTSGRMIGVSYTMGATTLLASMGSSNDKTTADVDKKIRGIGADYALSKRTNLYVRMDSRDANKNSSTDDSSNGTTKRTAVGIRHTF